MQAISEILTGIQTPAETGAGASSRPMMDGYNELTQWANDAINANSWRISPDQVLSGESERLLLELAAEITGASERPSRKLPRITPRDF